MSNSSDKATRADQAFKRSSLKGLWILSQSNVRRRGGTLTSHHNISLHIKSHFKYLCYLVELIQRFVLVNISI